MMLLADTAVAVTQITIDALAAGDMVAIVRARQRGAFRDPEVGFDGVQPGRLGGGPHGVNMQASE